MVAQVTGIIMAGATAVAYIIGEGLVDAAKQKTDIFTDENTGNTEGTEQKDTNLLLTHTNLTGEKVEKNIKTRTFRVQNP